MNHHQRDLRKEAAKAFIDSLDQLQDVLGSEASQKATKASPMISGRPSQPQKANPPLDSADLEQAAADIEAFIQIKSEPTE